MNGKAPLKTGRFLALFAALLLALAACSGSEDPEAVATEPALDPTTEAIETEATPTELDTEMATEAPTDMATEAETETDAADAGADTAATGQDILTALQDAGLTSVAAAVQASGLEQELANLPEFTLFAPNEDALLTMGQDFTAMDATDVRDLLLAHVVDEQVLTSELSEGENTFTTVGGSEVTITVTGDQVMVGDATVTQSDVEVGDTGVIHVIDTVLEPSA